MNENVEHRYIDIHTDTQTHRHRNRERERERERESNTQKNTHIDAHTAGAK